MEILPHFARPDPVIYEIVSALKSKLEFDRKVDRMYVDSAATFLTTHLIEHYSARKQNIREDAHSLSHRDLRQVIDYMNAHLDQNLGLADLANLVGISYYHFARLFKKSTGVSPGRYLILTFPVIFSREKSGSKIEAHNPYSLVKNYMKNLV